MTTLQEREDKQTRWDRFKEERYKEPHPSTYQEYVAWIAAGEPEKFKIKILVAPPKGYEDVWIETEPNRKWWEIWRRPSRLVKKDKPFELLVLSEEEYAQAAGFKPTEDQVRFLLIPGVMRGSREARYNKMVAEYQEFKSGEMQPKQLTQAQRMESWRRAGLAPGQQYVQKIYRDELGQLLGVSTFTPEEIEAMGGFKPGETEAKWAFRETRKIAPKEQFKIWAREHAEEEQRKEQEEQELREELTSLRTIRIEKGEDIPATLKIGGIDKLMARRRELEDMLGVGVDR